MTSPDPRQPPPAPTSPVYPGPQYGAPQQPYPSAPRPAAPRKKGMPVWAIVLIALGGLVVLVCGGGIVLLGLGAKGVSDSNKAASNDVTISSCSAEGGQYDLVGPKATIDITNHGSKTASYSVSVEFVSGSTQLGTGVALVNSLGPGQTGHADAASFKGGSATGSFQCRITKVSKF